MRGGATACGGLLVRITVLAEQQPLELRIERDVQLDPPLRLKDLADLGRYLMQVWMQVWMQV